MKNKYWILNKLGDGTPEIYLYGDIYPYEDCVNASALAKELKELEKTCTKINVRINSCGGSVYEGIAIFNLLRNSKCEIDTYIDGIAASMGSVIAMAGKKVYMSRYGQLMTHKPSGGAFGTAEELRKTADAIDGVEKIICALYMERTGMTEEQVREKLLNGNDVWLGIDEAMKIKLVDDTYDVEQQKPVAGSSVTAMWSEFNNVLAARLTAKVKQIEVKKPAAPDSINAIDLETEFSTLPDALKTALMVQNRALYCALYFCEHGEYPGIGMDYYCVQRANETIAEMKKTQIPVLIKMTFAQIEAAGKTNRLQYLDRGIYMQKLLES